MPFLIGNKTAEGHGRRGFELEQAQLKKMRSIVDKDLKIVEKIYKGKATEKDFKILQAVQVRISKYLDKLHSSRQSVEGNEENPFIVKVINYEGNINTLPVRSKKLPIGIAPSTTKI